ncbi:Uncharacterized protein Tcan_07942 [Toxocara canis]|uniref:Nuclear pore complex protein Nup88 n=1 Tax=Toxocara canis TaxID=6265 RepID=A0A0B2VQW2_TOXCA|nr:Uncharacterized protein Tcan_07942 [Toxocara canis]
MLRQLRHEHLTFKLLFEMGLLLEEVVSACKKPLICGYRQQGVLILDDDSLRLCAYFSTDTNGSAYYDHEVVLKIRPRLPVDANVTWIAANESGSRVALISSRGAFFLEVPRDIWASNMRLWNERIQPTYYCRCAAIGSALQIGTGHRNVLKARWYVKELDEVGQDKSDRIALLYSDSVIRIFDTSERAEIPIAKFDFRHMLRSDFSAKQSQSAGLGLCNFIASFDFGPRFKCTDAANEEMRIHTLFAVDNENGDIYVAPFHFDSPLSFQPSGPFRVEPWSRGEHSPDACDIIHVRHPSSPILHVFALITTGGVVTHFVPIPLQKAFVDGAVDYEMIAVDSFLLPSESDVSDELFLVNDEVMSNRYLVCGLSGVFWVDVKPSIAAMLATLKSGALYEAASESSENRLHHVFSVVGVEPSCAMAKITSACTVATGVQATEACSREKYGRKVLFAAVTGDSQLLSRCITIHYLHSNDKIISLNGAMLGQRCERIDEISLSDECLNLLRKRVTVPKVKLNGALSEEELVEVAGAVVDALMENLSIAKNAHQHATSKLSDAHQRKLDLEEQWEEVDTRTLDVVRGYLNAKNQIYRIRDSIEELRKRLDRIRSVLSLRAPMLTNAEKETFDKLEKMQSILKEQTQYIARLADEMVSRRRERFGSARPFQASFNARAFMLSKNSDDIVQLESSIKQLRKRLDTFEGAAASDSHLSAM